MIERQYSSDLDFLEDDIVNSGQFLTDLFVSGGVKEEDACPEDPVEDGEGAVEGNVLNKFLKGKSCHYLFLDQDFFPYSLKNV